MPESHMKASGIYCVTGLLINHSTTKVVIERAFRIGAF